MGKARITVVRHGETEWNRAIQMQGHQDSPLTSNGTEQAEQLAETIHRRKFDALITSDLGRARRTSEIINKHMNLPVETDANLRERAFGVMEGKNLDFVRENYNELYQAYLTRDKDYDVPDGESLVKFNDRVIDGVIKIANRYTGKHVLLVAHGGVLDCLLRKVFQIELDTERMFTIPNTSVNTFSINGDKWILEEWGNIEHLKQGDVLDEIK